MPSSLHVLQSFKNGIRVQLLANPAIISEVGNKIYDVYPRTSTPPYIVFGDANIVDDGCDCGEATQVFLDLTLFTIEREGKHNLKLLHEIENSLKSPIPPLEGYSIVTMELRKAVLRQDAKTLISRANLQLRAFIEPL